MLSQVRKGVLCWASRLVGGLDVQPMCTFLGQYAVLQAVASSLPGQPALAVLVARLQTRCTVVHAGLQCGDWRLQHVATQVLPKAAAQPQRQPHSTVAQAA